MNCYAVLLTIKNFVNVNEVSHSSSEEINYGIMIEVYSGGD